MCTFIITYIVNFALSLSLFLSCARAHTACRAMNINWHSRNVESRLSFAKARLIGDFLNLKHANAISVTLRVSDSAMEAERK